MIDYSFAKGLAQHEDDWLQADGFQTLENVRQVRDGSLEKFTGYVPQPADADYSTINAAGTTDTPTIASARLVRRGSTVGAVSGHHLSAYTTDGWVYQGNVSPWTLERTALADAGDGQIPGASGSTLVNAYTLDCCKSGEFVWTVAQRDQVSGGNIVVFASQNGRVVRQFTCTTASRRRVRIVAGFLGGNVLVFAQSVSTGTVYCASLTIAQASETFALTGACANGPSSTTEYDVTTDGTSVWVAYSDFTGGNVYVDRHANNGSAIATVGILASASIATLRPTAVSVAYSTGRVAVAFVGWYVNGGSYDERIRTHVLDASALTAVGSGQLAVVQTTSLPASPGQGRVDRVGVTLDATDAHTVWQTSSIVDLILSLSTVYLRSCTVVGVLGGAAGFVDQVNLLSKPFIDGERVCFLGNFHSEEQRKHYVFGVTANTNAGLRLRPLAAFSALTAYTPYLHEDTRTSTPYQDDDGVWHVQSLEHAGQGASRAVACDYALLSDARVAQFAEFGEQTYLTGALVTAWDGTRALEAGWCHDPEILDVADGTGGLLTAGTYYYKCTFARYSATGELLRSRPCATETHVCGGSRTVNVYALPCTITLQAESDTSDLLLEVWRTKPGETSPFYLVGASYIAPNSAGPMLHTDNYVITGTEEQLYTDGASGEVANDAPPTAVSITVWKQRLWLTDGDRISYTKEAVTSRAAEFSESFAVYRGTGERWSALGALGDVLAVFSARSSGYLYGEPPASSGAGSTLTGPLDIVSEYGCSDPQGIFETEKGLIVPTHRGVRMLSDRREWADIGSPIERVFDSFEVRGVDAFGDTGVIAWALSSGLALFDVEHGTWSVAHTGQDFTSSLRVGERHWVATTTDVLIGPAPNAIFGTFDGDAFAQTIETPWFKPAGLAGDMRVYEAHLLLLGAGGDITVSVGYDYHGDYSYTETLESLTSEFTGNSGLKPIAVRIPMPRQLCSAVRLKFTSSDTGSGWRYAGLRLAFAPRPKRGRTRPVGYTRGEFERSLGTQFTGALDSDEVSGPFTMTGIMVFGSLDFGSFSAPDGETNACYVMHKGSEWKLVLWSLSATDKPGRLHLVAGGGFTAKSAEDGAFVEPWIRGRPYHIAVTVPSYSPDRTAKLYVDGYLRGESPSWGAYPPINGSAAVVVPGGSPVTFYDVAFGDTLSADEVIEAANTALRKVR